MSFGSSFSSAFSSELGSSLGGAGLGLATSLYSASQSRNAAKQQQRYERDMSDTAHQREVKDLRAAGLNPVLSGMGGSGASTPQGATAQVPDHSQSVQKGLDALRLKKEIKETDSRIKLNEKLGNKAQAETANTNTINALNKTDLPEKTNNMGIHDSWYGRNILAPANQHSGLLKGMMNLAGYGIGGKAMGSVARNSFKGKYPTMKKHGFKPTTIRKR